MSKLTPESILQDPNTQAWVYFGEDVYDGSAFPIKDSQSAFASWQQIGGIVSQNNVRLHLYTGPDQSGTKMTIFGGVITASKLRAINRYKNIGSILIEEFDVTQWRKDCNLGNVTEYSTAEKCGPAEWDIYGTNVINAPIDLVENTEFGTFVAFAYFADKTRYGIKVGEKCVSLYDICPIKDATSFIVNPRYKLHLYGGAGYTGHSFVATNVSPAPTWPIKSFKSVEVMSQNSWIENCTKAVETEMTTASSCGKYWAIAKPTKADIVSDTFSPASISETSNVLAVLYWGNGEADADKGKKVIKDLETLNLKELKWDNKDELIYGNLGSMTLHPRVRVTFAADANGQEVNINKGRWRHNFSYFNDAAELEKTAVLKLSTTYPLDIWIDLCKKGEETNFINEGICGSIWNTDPKKIDPSTGGEAPIIPVAPDVIKNDTKNDNNNNNNNNTAPVNYYGSAKTPINSKPKNDNTWMLLIILFVMIIITAVLFGGYYIFRKNENITDN